MADPISIATGVVGLTAFAVQSTKALYEAIEKVKNNGRSIRELKEETISLTNVLRSLEETLTLSEIDLSVLQVPLRRCGQLCQELSVLLSKCSAHSDNGRFSIRDFFASTYQSKDLTEFRSLIAAYKSTIAVALADANIRHVNVTVKLLQEYQRTIDDTTSDLYELLQRCSEAPQDPSLRDNAHVQSHDTMPTDITEERANIEQCLAICAGVSKHIDEVQKESVLAQSGRSMQRQKVITLTDRGQAGQITSQRLQDCKTEIRFTSDELRMRLEEVNHRLAKLSREESIKGDHPACSKGMTDTEEELSSIRQCLSICQEATEQATSERINVFEDVSMADDGQQVIVSTFGDLISARRVTAGARSTQLLGQMLDASLQQVSKDYAARHGDIQEKAPSECRRTDVNAFSSGFRGQYGIGQKLS